MNYINALSFLPESFPEGQFSLPAWRDYAGRISPELAAKCEADITDYDFDREVVPVVQAALNRPDELARLQETFLSVTRQGQERMPLLFQQEPDICILLYLGLCSGAGWATSLDGAAL